MISPKQKIAIFTVCFVGLFAALVILAILPLLKQIKENSQEIASTEASVAVLDEQLESLAVFQRKQTDYQEYLKQAESGFVRADAPIIFMEFLEEQARITNLQITVSPVSQKEEDIFGLGLQVRVAGPFAQCLRFLERLEQSYFLIEISDIQVSRVAEEDIRNKRVALQFEGLKPGDAVMLIVLRTLAKQKPTIQEPLNNENT